MEGRAGLPTDAGDRRVDDVLLIAADIKRVGPESFEWKARRGLRTRSEVACLRSMLAMSCARLLGMALWDGAGNVEMIRGIAESLLPFAALPLDAGSGASWA